MPVLKGNVTDDATLAGGIAAAFLEAVPKPDEGDEGKTPRDVIGVLALAIADAIVKAVNTADADSVLTG